ncbi:MAG TPA: hypothetical protein VKF36_00745 [Syntrophorhabdales bacterium]|nr:hypothetical protein [Syntrophorhabdales bacterium]
MTLPVPISQILNGIAFGMLLFLLAAGLSLMSGLMGIVNLAHGAYFMVGGYVGLTTLDATDSFLLAILAGTGLRRARWKYTQRTRPISATGPCRTGKR